MIKLEGGALRRTVVAALAEDLGTVGDVTTDALVPERQRATAHIVARSDLILAGLTVAREVFRQLDPELEFVAHKREGDAARAGECVATLRGAARSMLRGERTALNFLMRMCGIASAARSAVAEIANSGAKILDTRKTAPGLRSLDKYAVAAGGALNHRLGLYDAVLIKDTHLAVVGSVATAVARARAAGHPAERITVEVRNVDQLRQAIDCGAGRALLDNMDPVALREAVKIGRGRIALEASGGLRPGALRAVAESGVDYLSLGYLTHSAPASDLAMEIEISS